jgi:hypothetical protein
MQSHKQQIQPSNNYLYRALVYGAKPFLYRGRVRSLLGFPEWVGGDVAYLPLLPPVGFRYADYNYPFPFMGNTPIEKSFAGNIHGFAFDYEEYAGPAGGKRIAEIVKQPVTDVHMQSEKKKTQKQEAQEQTPQKQEKEIVNEKGKLQEPELVKQVATDVQLQGKMESPGTPKFTVTFCKPRRHEEHEENNIIKTPFNKKFWEVQEPFFKRVLGRRRHRLMVDSGTTEDPERSEPTVNQVRLPRSDNKPGKRGDTYPSLSGQEDSREFIIGEAEVTEIRLPGRSDRSAGHPFRCGTDDMYGPGKPQGPEIVKQPVTDVQMQSEKKKTQKQEAQEQTPQKQEKEIVNEKVKLQEPEIVKQVETDVLLHGKMESPGTAEDPERSQQTVSQAHMPLSDNEPGQRAELKKERTQEQKPQGPGESVNSVGADGPKKSQKPKIENEKETETEAETRLLTGREKYIHDFDFNHEGYAGPAGGKRTAAIVKQVETDVRLQGKMESPGTAEDPERSEPTVDRAYMPLPGSGPVKGAELKKERTQEQKPQGPGESVNSIGADSPKRSQKPVSRLSPSAFALSAPTEKSFAGNIHDFDFIYEGSARPVRGKRMGTAEEPERSEPRVDRAHMRLSSDKPGKRAEPVSRLSPSAPSAPSAPLSPASASYWNSAVRIEQLRRHVHRLSAANTLKAKILSSSSGEKTNIDRQIEEGRPRVSNPPIPPVVIVKRVSTQGRTSRIPCAFWERSYLGRFHLRTLR